MPPNAWPSTQLISFVEKSLFVYVELFATPATKFPFACKSASSKSLRLVSLFPPLHPLCSNTVFAET